MRLIHIHWYRRVGTKGANAYLECRHHLCRKRKAVQVMHGYSPLDREWLEGRVDELDRPLRRLVRPGGQPGANPAQMSRYSTSGQDS